MPKGKIEINPDLCKGCGLCIAACPFGVLCLDSSKINKNGYSPAAAAEPEKCTACGSCALMCPDSAIKVIRI